MKLLSFEEWKAKFMQTVDESLIAEVEAIHNIDVRKEIDMMMRAEYELYLERNTET